MRHILDLQIRPYVLSTSVLLFLFAGFYKPYVPSPVDLTVVSGALTCLCVLLYWASLRGIIQPLTVALAILMLWTGIRLFPDMAPDGVRKFALSVFFGLPAVAAGFLIAKRPEVTRAFTTMLAYLSVPATGYLLLTMQPGVNAIGQNYQLTGIFLATCLIACAALGRFLLLVVAGVGLVITGHLAGILFGVAGVGAVWLWKGYRRQLYITALAGLLAALSLIPLNAAGLAPHAVTRVIAKVNYTMMFDPASVERAVAENDHSYEDAPIWQRDRIGLLYISWLRFLEEPVLGHGLGAADYLYDAYPHNFLAELATETGVIGLILGTALLALAVYAVASGGSAFAVGYLTLIVLTYMVSGMWGARLLFFGFGMAAGASVFRRDRPQTSSDSSGIPASSLPFSPLAMIETSDETTRRTSWPG